MPIKFPNLLQDSWNFMRNQAQFSVYAIVLLMVLQIVSFHGMPKIDPTKVKDIESVLLAQLVPSMISALISMFINAMIILNIKSINQGTYQHFFQNLGETLKVFFPLIGLTIFMVLPVSIGVSFAGTVGQSGELSIMILPLMLAGIYIFVKLNLAVYAYLIEDPRKSVIETLKFTWGLSRGKMALMFLFCIIAYMVPSLLGSVVVRFNDPTGLTPAMFSGFIGVFVAVFGFRFYQVFRALPR
ncbi:hypothetical protein [Glaesserella sp.]|uniref:hypothetical protein n=1 Tax=Glaesserella sp. TaxID=2094731 RepID=UPI0035A115A0